jgi:hypothetical protein
MIFSEMSIKEKINFILLGRNDPYFRREYNWLGITTTPENLIGSLALRVKGLTGPRPKDAEILEVVKSMYCTFHHTGGYNQYHNLLAYKKVSKFQSRSACTVEQFINYKGRQVPNSEVKFYLTAEEAKRENYK